MPPWAFPDGFVLKGRVQRITRFPPSQGRPERSSLFHPHSTGITAMMRLHRFLAVTVLTVLSLSAARAQEPIRFARTPDISPDGKLVAFSYLGDIWIVETIGGIARPVTMHEAHDIHPVFSPDGRYLAFSSNRHGSYDVH